MSVFSSVQSWIDRLVPKVLFEDTDSLRKGRLIVFSGILVSSLSAIYFLIFLWLAYPPGVILCAYGCLSSLFCIYLLNRKASTNFAGTFFAASAFGFFAAFTIMAYGIETGISIWVLMAPLSAMLMVSTRSAIFWSLMSFALLGVLLALHLLEVPLPPAFDRKFIPFINFISVFGFLIYGLISIMSNERVKEQALKALKVSNASIQEKQILLKRKNEEIVAVNRELEAKIAQRTIRLRLTNEELDTFLYESSHAMRRPLVRILGLANIIRIADSEEERNGYLENIEFTAKGMDIMLQDLLRVSQINNRPLTKRPLRAASFFHHLIKDLNNRLEFGQVEIQVHLSQNWLLEVDSFMLRSAVEAILINAFQYRNPDSPTCLVQIREQLHGKGLSFTIEDFGTGIHPHALRDVYKMFSKGTEKSKGSGLGLYIAQKAIHRVNGQIKIESELGTGTRVTLTFPPYLVEQIQNRHPVRKANPEAIKRLPREMKSLVSESIDQLS